MTKPKTDFADDDWAIARRARWVLEGHPPGREQPPPDLDLQRLVTFNGSDARALALARFGTVRFLDALSASPPPKLPLGRGPLAELRVAEGEQRLALMHEAVCLEKKASEHSRVALLRLSNAVEACQTAAAKRADIWAGMPAERTGAQWSKPSSERQKILEDLLAAEELTREALVQMDAWVRLLPSAAVIDSFPSTSGLPLAQRNDVLGDQALSLSEAGVSVEAIGYVMGWDYGTPEQSKDRTRKRLEEARVRRRPPAL